MNFIGNPRFSILHLSKQLLYYINIKESCLFVAKIVESLDLNILRRSGGLVTVFSCLDRF